MPGLRPLGADPGRRGRGRRRGGGHRRGRLRRRRLPPGRAGGPRPHHPARPGRRRHRRQDRRQPARGQEPGRRLLAARPPCCATPRPSPPCRPASTAAAWARWPSTPSSAWTRLRDLSLDDAVAACVACKAEVVGADERESGGRALLNYGHTLAHALETVGRLRPAPRRGGRHRAGLRRPPGPPAGPHRRRTGGRARAPGRRLRPARPGCRPAWTRHELIAVMGRDKKATPGG